MMAMGLVALVANTVCLVLISKHCDGEVHMCASWIFSKNDVIANVGVILAGALVAVTASCIPDLVIGIAVALLVLPAWWGTDPQGCKAGERGLGLLRVCLTVAVA